jgi:hypothetical protein
MHSAKRRGADGINDKPIPRALVCCFGALGAGLLLHGVPAPGQICLNSLAAPAPDGVPLGIALRAQTFEIFLGHDHWLHRGESEFLREQPAQ